MDKIKWKQCKKNPAQPIVRTATGPQIWKSQAHESISVISQVQASGPYVCNGQFLAVLFWGPAFHVSICLNETGNAEA